MGQMAAKQGDRVTATDIHIVVVPVAGAPVPTPLPHPFSGTIGGALSRDVRIQGKSAAMVDSTADNNPVHIPTPPGISFQSPPSNRATIKAGSQTVRINGKAAARNGDPANTCNDPAELPVGTVVASGTVRIG
jgi:uncharacterized Zn-binding protein involved in type VI secretion